MRQDETNVQLNGGLNRRDFLKLGTGLVVYFSLEPLQTFATGMPMSATELPGANPLQPMPQGVNFNSFLQIAPDGRVTCKVGKVDLGQGLRAAMAQHVADELDVSFDAIDMIMGDTDLCPWDVGTFGSGANRLLSVVLRSAAAEGRAVLLQMAAERFAARAERDRGFAGVDQADRCAPAGEGRRDYRPSDWQDGQLRRTASGQEHRAENGKGTAQAGDEL